MKKTWWIITITILLTALTLLFGYNVYGYLSRQFPDTYDLAFGGCEEDICYPLIFFILEIVASLVIVYYHDIDFSSKRRS